MNWSSSARFHKILGAIAIGFAVCALAGASLATLAPSRAISKQNPVLAQVGEAPLQTPNTLQDLPAPLRTLLGPGQSLNGPALGAQDFQGKVVLVNFWTYTCINSLRPLPYLRAWAEKYRDRGLVVVGVHTPEFDFEHDAARVERMLADLPVGYPVKLDNEQRVWNAFANSAWPAFYFIDSHGRIRHHVLGEGGYDESERWIQKLLSEATGKPVTDALSHPVGEGAQAAPDWKNIRTPETYVGFAQGSNFSSPGGTKRNSSAIYSVAPQLGVNHWSLSGQWTVRAGYASLDKAAGKISYRFHARDLHLVLGRVDAGGAIRFRVTLDGQAPGADHGSDIDADGWGILDNDRMYQLIRQTGAVADRTFEIEFLAPGARAYSFTFG